MVSLGILIKLDCDSMWVFSQDELKLYISLFSRILALGKWIEVVAMVELYDNAVF